MFPAHLPLGLNAIGVGLANHLWQSTLFAAGVGASTLLFRKNSAIVRYRLWLIASLKFLIPFSLLVGIGSHLGWHVTPQIAQSQLPTVIRQMGQPFEASLIAVSIPASSRNIPPRTFPFDVALLLVWGTGAIAVFLVWWVQWFRVVRLVRQALPIDTKGLSQIRILASPAGLEPGVFGILRPVLLLPEGADLQLSTSQLDAIIAHEMFHVRGHDNLAAALHTIVEALFWFHPLVWWIGGRLVDERERACDEAVLHSGHEADDYASGILKVCECYVKAPVCVSGVSGTNLKQRIEAIMNYQGTRKLNFGKQLILAAAGTGILLCPLFAGMMHASVVPGASIVTTPVPVLELASKSAAAVVPQQNPVQPAVQEPNVGQRQRWGDNIQVIVNSTDSAISALLVPIQNSTQPAAQGSNTSQQWLDDVSVIITDAERLAFGRLGSDAERESFVVQFWLQRDPTPGTPQNEFKDEYYRRIAYANEHFAAGVQGLKTDRGKMYLLYGPPDEIQTHATGGTYYRPAEQGGGVTNTFPFETWRYRRIDGKGDNIIYEFVDMQLNGDYRLEYDPGAKLK